MSLDMAFIRDKFPDARDIKEDGPMGVVVVFEGRTEQAQAAIERLALAVKVIIDHHAAELDVAYFSTGYNRNAHSLDINFKPISPASPSDAAGGEVGK